MKQSISAFIATTEKNKKFLEQLVDSLYRQTVSPEKVVIIYDGLLRPGEKVFRESLLSISWIDNRQGRSLTVLQNEAIRFSKEDLVLLLNDDVVLETKFIEELAKMLKLDESIGMVCGKILGMDKVTIDTTGQFLAKNRKPQDRGYGQKDEGQYNSPGLVFGACGAAVLYRREMLNAIQISPGEYFDNDYHMFYEDLDIAWRAQNAGWKAYYNPKAVAYHARGASARTKKPPLKIFERFYFTWLDIELKSHFIKNRWMTIIKNDTSKGFLLNLPQIIGYDIKIFLYCLFFDPRALVKALKNFPFIMKAFKKRKLIFKKNK
ncbi:MAG: glycosyltransferase family 2 protein [Candidatus Omnitrophota bacterium]